MFINPIYLSNRFGIPRIEPSALTVGSTNVILTTPSNRAFSENYNGLLLMKFTDSIPTGTTTTLPIVVNSAVGGTQAITLVGGAEYTVAEYTTGIHLFYYESNTGTLQYLV